MRVKQSMFFRQFGVRERSHLTTPRLIPTRKLELPFESIYHFNPDDTVSIGPSGQDTLFQIKNRVFIEHVVELTSKEGSPRRTVINPITLQNEYRRKNRLFKPLRKPEALTINDRNVLVINYAMLSSLYRYIPSFKAEYFRWQNIASTVWNNVELTHSQFGWNQYMELPLPETIPTYSQFRRIEAGLTQESLRAFSTPAALGLLDLYHWLGDNRQSSNLSVLSSEAIAKVNFVVRIRGYFFVLNLGVLDAWRKDEDVENDTGMSGSVLQRRFITLLHGLRDLQSGVTQVGDSPEAQIVEETGKKPKLIVEEEEEVEEDEVETVTDKPKLKALPDMFDLTLPEPVTPPDFPKVVDQSPPVMKTEAEVRLPQETTSESTIDEEAPTSDEILSRGIYDRAKQLHDVGLMSAKAFQRTLEDAETYKTLPDPYGSGKTLAEAMVELPEDKELPAIEEFPDSKTIPDRSMLSSKLYSMQRKYIKKLLHKNVLASVMAVQTQGIAVKGYTINTVRDAMNHYEEHVVTLKPVRGKQSTVRFRLPVLNRYGQFVSNGSLYSQKYQRADIPLRKVFPHKVALTSYYNKTFVERSQRKTNDFEGWLVKKIVTAASDDNDPFITNLKLSNVFDQSVDIPRMYSVMAKRITSLNAGDKHLYFNYRERVGYFAKRDGFDVKAVEAGGMVVVGSFDGQPITVDSNNTFYTVDNQGALQVLGTLFDLLQIDPSGAPMEVAQMTVSNKTIPVGLVLAYHMGLSELISYLGCEVSRFRRGERNIQTSDEYAITFQDEVLIFSRLDTKSAMILAGFNRFHAVLKQHSVWDFDRKDVYHRVLNSAGMGVRYLREIDTLFASWVDPITKSLLEDMNEPTEYRPLLIRAVELLMTDWSPEEVDGAYMRYRGYERFAGAVYGELMRSCKLFNARIGVGEPSVELNPHVIWQGVVGDPAVGSVEQRNPMQDIREQEGMTYRGRGGRSGKSMVERTRIYHQSDMGVVSESTVDSGDVGVIAYLSPDANFTNLYGVTRPFDPKLDGITKVMSTASLVSPESTFDDPKRIGSQALVPLSSNTH